MIKNKNVRILAVAPLSRGFGYAVMEGPDRLVAHGNKVIIRDKNVRALAWVEKFIHFYKPDVLVLPDVNAPDTRRAPRIKALHRKIGALARKHQIKLRLISISQIRTRLLGHAKGTKQALAEALAAKFPAEFSRPTPTARCGSSSKIRRSKS